MRFNRLIDLIKGRITLYQFVTGSKTISKIWDVKNYFEIGNLPIGFITSKLPLMSSLLLFWVYWGKIRESPIILLYIFCAFWAVFLIGVIWRKGGFYTGERESETRLDPITNEIYEAAKIINKKWGKK